MKFVTIILFFFFSLQGYTYWYQGISGPMIYGSHGYWPINSGPPQAFSLRPSFPSMINPYQNPYFNSKNQYRPNYPIIQNSFGFHPFLPPQFPMGFQSVGVGYDPYPFKTPSMSKPSSHFSEPQEDYYVSGDEDEDEEKEKKKEANHQKKKKKKSPSFKEGKGQYEFSLGSSDHDYELYSTDTISNQGNKPTIINLTPIENPNIIHQIENLNNTRLAEDSRIPLGENFCPDGCVDPSPLEQENQSGLSDETVQVKPILSTSMKSQDNDSIPHPAPKGWRVPASEKRAKLKIAPIPELIGKLDRPVLAKCRITGTMEFRKKHPVHGDARWHRGTDLAATTGANIYSVADGRVYEVGTKGGYGKTIVIAHNQGGTRWYSLYAHLSRYYVSKGQVVKSGQQIGQAHKGAIGAVGQTGTATGPHLHLEFLTKDFGNRDPQKHYSSRMCP